MEDYKNKNWFENYLGMLETNIDRLESRVETACCVDKMCGMERLISEKFESNEKALITAKEALDKRLDSMNEFREALREQAAKMMTRDEYNVNHEAFRNQLNELSKAKERMEGKASQSSLYVATAIAVLSLFIGAIHVLRDVIGLTK